MEFKFFLKIDSLESSYSKVYNIFDFFFRQNFREINMLIYLKFKCPIFI